MPDSLLHDKQQAPIKVRLLTLTSLRFICALFIFFLHSSNHGLTLPYNLYAADLSKAVSFFFVLSGFVLTYSRPTLRFNIYPFYLNRLIRIVPVSLLSLLFVSFFLNRSLYLPSENSFQWYNLLALLSHLTFIHSFIPIPDFFLALMQ